VISGIISVLYDVYGRTVYSVTCAGNILTIGTGYLAQGNYILRLTNKEGNKNTYKIGKE